MHFSGDNIHSLSDSGSVTQSNKEVDWGRKADTLQQLSADLPTWLVARRESGKQASMGQPTWQHYLTQRTQRAVFIPGEVRGKDLL